MAFDEVAETKRHEQGWVSFVRVSTYCSVAIAICLLLMALFLTG